MATENGRGLQNALQATIDRYLQTEGPKIGLIHRKLEELRGLLADEQITEEQFFRRLIDETEPIRTFVCICGETFQLERTSESQIIISPQSTANSDYYVVAVADFDQDGKFRAKGIAHYRGKPIKRKTIPSLYGKVSVDDEAREMISDFPDFGNYNPLANSLRNLPVEEFFPID
ncbi:MAG: hypothetical protein A3A58_03290 [Candidatus Blackburnbacteria bacterium RIFCSPLOWO2_01_FULL_41_27]|uniref:Uncharacterized protein n=2 Tax=Candidatus Blackburniibacteriota TaxID=1817898 RepID=A0A1G1V6T7_9BACT|nr:MAG: hypothetical protein A3F61_04465 [Candidatus Blackburnbacteria bacterium RIFCSPHIGHO2_12_FULL_41_13b]OGY13040.1 MAG: hypothetical protein A3A58_03290 [Candidatus Blackburnbacteria bacterium RIFCSPLOWO2_01_FULL_41_27]